MSNTRHLLDQSMRLDALYLAADAATWAWIRAGNEDVQSWEQQRKYANRLWRRYEQAVAKARGEPLKPLGGPR